MRSPAKVARLLASIFLIYGSSLAAEPQGPATPATKQPPLLLHEIWVPSDALDPILARYPRAVSLGRDQLLTLLQDAADPAAVDPATLPPERAVLRQARFDGHLTPNSQVQVSGELEVEVFSDQWAQVPLGLPGVTLGTAEIDDGRPANLRRLPGKGDRPAVLLIQGRGVHRLRLGFVLPVAAGPESSVALPSVAGAGEFTLHLPAGARADGAGGCVVQPDGAGVVVRAALDTASKNPLRWHTPPPSLDTATAILQEGKVDALVGESAVTIRQEVVLRATLGKLPGETLLRLPPEAHAIRLEDTTNRWDVGREGLQVALDPAADKAAFQVLYELPLSLNPDGSLAKVGVPLLEATVAHRVTGRIVIRQASGVQVRQVKPVPLLTPEAGAATSDFVASFSVVDLPVVRNAWPPEVVLEARRTRTRFSVDADARVSFPPGVAAITRNLTVHVEEGTLFGVRVPLPKGETLVSLDSRPAADWRQEGDDLFLAWTAGIPETAAATVRLETQADFAPPTAGTPTPFRFRAVPVPGAERLTGYVAVSSTPALRVVTTGGEERLERRDGRTTPVRGEVAWFYRDGFDLALRVERRATETEARFTGDALPLAGAVEIHGQIDYRFLHAGVDTVKIRVPGDAADAFFFTGEHIAERRREGDVWTIRFQGEQTGDYALGVQATIPTPADKHDAERFHFRLPTVAPLDTARWSGVWAVEANTDTEIHFHAVGASEVDTLHAPALAGYQPRRRVIGVFEFLGGGAADAAIDLDGVRHPAAGVAAAVVDSLVLETFASTSGVARHRATLRARTAGDGFFNIRLPDGAALWSLTRDGALIKPVGGAAGDLRVELPGGRDPAAASTVVVVYETPGQPWANSGSRTLAAPRFDPGVPVVNSRWTLHVPDGFDYRLADGALINVPATVRTGDLLLPQIGGALGHMAQWAYYYPRYLRAVEAQASGIADPRPLGSVLPAWMVAQLSGKSPGSPVVTELDTGPVLGEPVQELILPKDQDKQNSAGADQVAEITRQLQRIIIPSVEFHGTTINDAIEFLRQEYRRVDPDHHGLSIFLKLSPTTPAEPAIPGLPAPPTPAADTRITLTLKNIPVLEALRYVAQQPALKVKVEQYAVSIVPLSEVTDALVTREFQVSPTFISSSTSGGSGGGALSQSATSTDQTGTGSVTVQRQDARTFLEASGVTFPPGASATYLASTGKLVVRNTQANLDLIEPLHAESDPGGIGAKASDALLYGGAGKPNTATPTSVAGVLNSSQFQPPKIIRDAEARVAGRLPILLDLPRNGVTYEFAGGGEPGTLAFGYTDWRTAARGRWIWLTLGAAAFGLGAAGWAHPWRRTLWAVLALTFWPLVAVPSALTVCNALLAGWLWAVLGWALSRWLLRRQRLVTLAILCAAALLPTAAHAAPKAAPTPPPAPRRKPSSSPTTRRSPPPPSRRPVLPALRAVPHPLGRRQAPPPTRRARAPARRRTLHAEHRPVRRPAGRQHADGRRRPRFPDVRRGLGGCAAQARRRADPRRRARVALGRRGPVGRDTRRAPPHRHPAPARRNAGGGQRTFMVRPTHGGHAGDAAPPATGPANGGSQRRAGRWRRDRRPPARRPPHPGGSGRRDHDPAGVPGRAAPGPGGRATGAGADRLAAERRRTGGNRPLGNQLPVSGPHAGSFHGLPRPGRHAHGPECAGNPGVAFVHRRRPPDARPRARGSGARWLHPFRGSGPLPAAGRRAPARVPDGSAGAGRSEQTAVLLAGGVVEITLPDGPPKGARRTEWSARPDDDGRVFGAFGSDGSPRLVYSVDARPEKRAAHIDYLFQPGRGKLEWAAAVRLSPETGDAPIQTADLRLPPGATVQAVAGGAVRQWWREGDVLSLRFGRGEASFIVYLVQSLEPVPGKIILPALGTPGFAETDGESVVVADRSFRVGLALPTGARARDLSEIDPGKAAAEFQVKAPLERQRAFRYRNHFEVGATLELLPARWQTQTVTQATVREGTVALAIRVNVEAQQGALDALEFSLPAGLPEAGVNGPDVRETIPLPVPAGQDRQTYRVLWQNPVYGGSEAAFTVTLELPLGAGGKALLPDLRFPGARAGSAFLLVENASSGEMALDPRGLDPAVEKDVPFLPATLVAGTRFFRVAPGVPWSLGIAVATLETTAGRAALVAYAELTSTLRADGEEWHRATYRLQNRRLQFLPVELPPGVELVGARVAGESVRVDAGQARTLLVPLLRTRPGELSYDVELVYRRPAPATGGQPRRTWNHWQLDDPKLPGIPVEKTLWDVFLPGDHRLLSSGGNVEPVVAALNETEKLESALSDLRSLSATYQSASATRQEQQLALDNFNSLAADVKTKAMQGDDRRRDVAGDVSSAFFKKPDVLSQNVVVSQKQRLIQSELDSLNTANVAAQQTPRFVGGLLGGGGRSYDVNGGLSLNGSASARDFSGTIQYGSPINGPSGNASASGQLPQSWRDNRSITLDQNRPDAFGFNAQSASGSAANSKRQLALNDSVTVDLPAIPLPAQARKGSAGDADVMDQRFLSTARATAAPVEARAESTPVPTVSSSPRQPALRGEAAIPGLPADAGAGTRTEALRPVGRISLAVNFPQEGQVYHFKKLKGDAHLILWSVRPAAFERVAWLLVLAALLVIGALVRRMARPRVGAAPLPTRTTA